MAEPGHTETIQGEEVATNERISTKEIAINKPTPFTGDRTKIRGFIQECQGYLQLNKKIYTTDDSKIAFLLSFLTDKEALKWKETYLASITTDEWEFDYPTFKEFLNVFSGYFKPINQAQTANNRLATLKQGKRTVEEFVAEFRLLISLAGMTSETAADNIHLINYFQRALNPAIAKKIALSDNVPTTIAEWAEKAIQYDTNYRLTMAMFGKSAYANERSFGGQLWRSSGNNQRDPNAMDIDAMTTEKREYLMKQGLCFKCEERGHLARDCKKKKKDAPPQKKNIKNIHALLSTLTKEEEEELVALRNTQKEDF
jgi:Ty3 transposon capsid-like protein/Zinc knuckle